jgi:hypothetical protein
VSRYTSCLEHFAAPRLSTFQSACPPALISYPQATQFEMTYVLISLARLMDKHVVWCSAVRLESCTSSPQQSSCMTLFSWTVPSKNIATSGHFLGACTCNGAVACTCMYTCGAPYLQLCTTQLSKIPTQSTAYESPPKNDLRYEFASSRGARATFAELLQRVSMVVCNSICLHKVLRVASPTKIERILLILHQYC